MIMSFAFVVDTPETVGSAAGVSVVSSAIAGSDEFGSHGFVLYDEPVNPLTPKTTMLAPSKFVLDGRL
jgi:hypothetical protein